MDTSGNNRQKVFDCEPDCLSPTFSRDGTTIAFSQVGDIRAVAIGNGSDWDITSSGYSTGAPIAPR